MKEIVLPETYNYIAVFLTFLCNYRCSYCLNHFGRNALSNKKLLSGRDWIRGLNRLVSRDDLPVTLQGGEPSLHPDFTFILNHIETDLNIDILTNLQFDVEKFRRAVASERLKRDSPYASIRVSFHPEAMDLDEVISKTKRMLDSGYSIGIWGVLHPKYESAILKAKERCEREGLDFKVKEFLGQYEDRLYGTYKYDDAFDNGHKKRVLCKTAEFIIGPDGCIFRCHSDCYKGRNPIGHILDPEFRIEDRFRECSHFGDCNPCDIKVKTNRFQRFGHTSVAIKYIK